VWVWILTGTGMQVLEVSVGTCPLPPPSGTVRLLSGPLVGFQGSAVRQCSAHLRFKPFKNLFEKHFTKLSSQERDAVTEL
jgi:hypothetical protein